MLEVSLAPTPAAPGLARAALAAWLARERPEPSFIEIALLLVSELVTNSVRHATTGPADTVRLTADTAPAGVRIAVRDAGTRGSVRLRTDRREDDVGGFGLELVARLSRDWGVERDEHGTTVWLELAPAR
jgi:anti-sigma regulatory factor (Ser/Thr protein kinase)